MMLFWHMIDVRRCFDSNEVVFSHALKVTARRMFLGDFIPAQLKLKLVSQVHDQSSANLMC
jgi:hypothetical protein